LARGEHGDVDALLNGRLDFLHFLVGMVPDADVHRDPVAMVVKL
jgi:hypothetical protein